MHGTDSQACRQRPTEWLLGLAGLPAVGLLGWADLATAELWPFALLQLLSVMALSYWAGKVWGLIAALIAAVIVLIPGSSLDAAALARWSKALFRLAALGATAVLVARLRNLTAKERELATTDPLTGLGNRALFLDRAAAELNRSRRTAHRLTVAYLDVDDFKTLNDTHGHIAGDRVLTAIGETLITQTRNYDVAARLGGDEFAVLLPETDSHAAGVVIERLHHCLTDAMQKCTATATISIGAATFEELPETVEELLHAADQTMYAAKHAGKACVRCVVVAASQLVSRI